MTFKGLSMQYCRVLCSLICLLVAASPALAQWKWKDGTGQVHVSDMPPPREVQDKDILQRPIPAKRAAAAAPAASGASAAAGLESARQKSDPELEARKARLEAEQKAKAKADEDKLSAQRAENCQRARQHLATLQSGMRIARVNAKGEREFLDDGARAQEVQSTQRLIESDCR